MKPKNFENYVLILAISNYCNWLDASPPIHTKKNFAQTGIEIPNTNFRDSGRKKVYDLANCQSRNKKHAKPVKAVSYSIKAANCNVLIMIQYVLFVQYTQPKYRDLSKNNTRI